MASFGKFPSPFSWSRIEHRWVVAGPCGWAYSRGTRVSVTAAVTGFPLSTVGVSL